MRFLLSILLSIAPALAAPSTNGDGKIEARGGSTRIVHVFSDKIEPAELTANLGDSVWFKFGNGINSVVQSEYDSPCQSSAKGIDSGIFYNPEETLFHEEAFIIDIKNNEPIWYYNAESDNCFKHKNVAVINAPEDGSQTLLDYSNRVSSAANPNKFHRRQGGGIIELRNSERWGS
ncbi:putative GPI-anchored cupredoxin [Ceratocystis lukuohia]|uniref:GPI-anchored cupredoxin n=1 Tax=Ceratocystis lukuohia TaxID=2019550 RepID=A0ABR4M8M1_9PEZI